MTHFSLLGLLFLLCLVVIPTPIGWFEAPKVVIAQITMQALIISELITHPKLVWRRLNRIYLSLVLGLFVISLITLVPNFQPESFWGNIYRAQGIWLFWSLWLFSVVIATQPFNLKFKLLPLISLLVLAIAAVIFGPNPDNRLFGTLGEPNALAATAVFLLPFILNYLSGKFQLLGIVTSLMIIWTAQSYSGLIGFGIVLGFWLAIHYLKLSLKIATIIAVIVLMMSLVLPFLIIPQGRFERRDEIWVTAFEAGLERPWVGWGVGNVDLALATASENLRNNIRFQPVDSSHNIWLDYLVQLGLPGLATLIVLIGLTFYRLIKYQQSLQLSVLLGLLTVTAFNPTSVVILIGFWWVIGQGMSLEIGSN